MPALNIETGNGILVHDVKWDFYGQRLAIGSSDTTVKIIGLTSDSSPRILAVLEGHQGAVLQIAWAHPKFGSILASCSQEGRVIIWKEGNQNEWKEVHVFHEHKSSVNCISWAPHELMLCLACGSSDGSISVLAARSGGGWDVSRIGEAHSGGVTSVSWGPAVAPGLMPGLWVFDPVPKLASGGHNSTMKVWKPQNGTWKIDCIPIGQSCQVHLDLARDVDVVTNLGLSKSTIVSPSEDDVVLGDGEKKESRNHFWSVEDDKLLINAWLNISKENDWENLALWRRMARYFEENRKGGFTRNHKQLNARWHRIRRSVKKFVECYDQTSQECQGETDKKEIISRAHKLYQSQNDGHFFQLEHAWMLLKDEPKWKVSMNISSNEDCSKRMKVSETGARMSSSNPDTSTNRDIGSSETCEADLKIYSVKKPVESKGTSKDERKAIAMEELAQTRQMEVDMQLIYKDTSSMNEEQLQLHVQLVQKLKQKCLL